MTEISARDRAIIADYIAGISVPAICDKHGMGKGAIGRVVNAAAQRGDLVKRQDRWGGEREALHNAVLEMHLAGKRNAEIAHALQRSKGRIEGALRCLRDEGRLPPLREKFERAPRTSRRQASDATGEILGCRVSVGAKTLDLAQAFLDQMTRSVADMRAARLAGCAA